MSNRNRGYANTLRDDANTNMTGYKQMPPAPKGHGSVEVKHELHKKQNLRQSQPINNQQANENDPY